LFKLVHQLTIKFCISFQNIVKFSNKAVR